MSSKLQKKKQYFLGEFEIIIKDYSNLYSFFQTKKEFRKAIGSINFLIKYDFLTNRLSLERLSIDNKTNDNVQRVIEQFNQENKFLKNRTDLRNLFNFIAEEL